MPDSDYKAKKEISWSYKVKKTRKNSESIIILWIVAITISIIVFIFSRSLISSLVVLSAAFALHAHFQNMKEDQENSIALSFKGVRVNKLLYPYKNIRRYNIIKNPENPEEKLLVLDLISILTPDLVIPLNKEVDEDEIDLYLSQFVEEDENMQIPFTHTLAQLLGM